MSIMRIMRKSIFLFELEAGIALFSQGKNKQAAKGEKVKQTTLGCALQETSLQKLLASDTICLEIRLSINSLSILTLFFLPVQWTNRVFYILKSAN